MTPVDIGTTAWGSQPSADATPAVIARASTSPCGPVHALAFPLLTTTALIGPALT